MNHKSSLGLNFPLGATFIAVPSEVYAFGSMYMISGFSAVIVSFGLNFVRYELEINSLPQQQGIALIYIYLPVFYDLQLTSSFFYLEKRFSRKVRLMSSMIYILCALLFIPIVM